MDILGTVTEEGFAKSFGSEITKLLPGNRSRGCSGLVLPTESISKSRCEVRRPDRTASPVFFTRKRIDTRVLRDRETAAPRSKMHLMLGNSCGSVRAPVKLPEGTIYFKKYNNFLLWGDLTRITFGHGDKVGARAKIESERTHADSVDYMPQENAG